MSKVKNVEFKFAVHIPKNNDRPDGHMVKEIITYDDGRIEPNVRIIENFKRPFYVTKEHYRNHKQKKEFEDISKVNTFMSTQSDLANSIAGKLGMTGYRRNNLRDIRDSPYIYGVDIDSRTILHHKYKEKYPDTTPNTVSVLDIEADVATREIFIISIAMGNRIYSRVTKKYIKTTDIDSLKKKIRTLMYENIPLDKEEIDKLEVDLGIDDTPMDAIRNVFKTLHKWKPDFLSIWNVLYDINVIVDTCKEYNVDPRDIFSDPSVPKECRIFRIKEGRSSSMKESGKETTISVQDRWHVITSTSSFYIIDNMCAYSYVRVGANAVPGGYGLGNILNRELKLGKLKFESHGIMEGTIEWHKHMSSKRPLEYLVYNFWDNLGVVKLEEQTSDLSINVPSLCGYSSVDIFDSGPKKILDAFYFYGLDNKKVIGTRPTNIDDDKILNLKNWILTLEAYRIEDSGYCAIKDNPTLKTNIKTHTYDSDAVSSYPSDTVAINLSKETTKREVISIEGKEKEFFKTNNINLIFGNVNSVSYCSNMLGFDTLKELNKKIHIE